MEDMKVNRGPNKPLTKKASSSSHVINLKKEDKNIISSKAIENNIKKEEIKKENNKVERIKEEKINEFLKSRDFNQKRIKRTPSFNKKHGPVHKITVVILIICVLIGLFYWGGIIFQKANVTITLKHQNIEYKKQQFIATKEQTSDNTDPINFEIMIVSDKQVKNLILTDTKEVSEKAKGTITLYNEFGMNPQIIAAGSFISDSEGKAYKIDKTVSVPGYKLDNKKNKVIGKVDVSITSFLPGDIYNGSPDKFYVNAFKNTNKYEKIYGEIKTPLEGGASGTVYVLNDSNKETLKKIVENSVKNDLFNKVKAQIPQGYILYPEASSFSYTIDDSILSKTTQADVEVEGSLSVILLDRESLINKIIKMSLSNVSSEEEKKEITLNYLDDLSFSFVNSSQIIDKDMENISFYLDGTIDAIWNPDLDILKKNLAGQNKNDVSSIFKNDPGISSAVVKIFPPWQKDIPDKSSDINIIIK